MRIIKITIFILFLIFCYPFTQGKAEEHNRAMTFMDIIQMRRIRGKGAISPQWKMDYLSKESPFSRCWLSEHLCSHLLLKSS